MSRKSYQDDMRPLYEAYSQLGRLQERANLTTSPPAILVVGHQTDGKSALIEAIMGFQFNHVGGGTKTRRPIRLEMRFDPDCHEPKCWLANENEDNVLEEIKLEDLQKHIQVENDVLSDQETFLDTDIIVRMNYEHSPNITIIDTPGLIAAAVDKPELQRAAQQVKDIVEDKMSNPSYIILCLESQDDWANATTRNPVMQEDIDPKLQRTVVVSTKLDTQIPKFAVAADAKSFISPTEHFEGLSPLGKGPFFTSVPSGRLGTEDCSWQSNNDFVCAIHTQELRDLESLACKMRQPVTDDQKRRVGVSKLKGFLEEVLLREYMKQLPTIMATLKEQGEAVDRRLLRIEEQLRLMQLDNLKEQVWDATSSLAECLAEVGAGTARLPTHLADFAGKTLEEEHIEVGPFTCHPLYGKLPDVTHYIEDVNGNERLYGGAQFRRVKNEIKEVLESLEPPEVDKRAVLIGSSGMGEMHDGCDVSKVAAAIGVQNASGAFENLLTTQLGKRNAFVLKCMLRLSKDLALHQADRDSTDGKATVDGLSLILDKAVEHGEELIEESMKKASDKVREDIRARAEYFTWEGHSPDMIKNCLKDLVEPMSKRHEYGEEEEEGHDENFLTWFSNLILGTQQQSAVSLIPQLAAQIFTSLRDQFRIDANVKFNSSLYNQVMQKMLKHLQKKMADEDMQALLDVEAECGELKKRKAELLEEKKFVGQLNDQFNTIKLLLRKSTKRPLADHNHQEVAVPKQEQSLFG